MSSLMGGRHSASWSNARANTVPTASATSGADRLIERASPFDAGLRGEEVLGEAAHELARCLPGLRRPVGRDGAHDRAVARRDIRSRPLVVEAEQQQGTELGL